jgi:hypothetical protein
VTPGALGAKCDGNTPCNFGFACFKGACVAAPGQGAPCDLLGLTNPSCDLSQALYCDVTSHTCAAAPFGASGDPCGLVGTAYKLCGGAFYCTAPNPLAQGTCRAKAADGAACTTDVTKGAPCLLPAVCVNGICTIPDATKCN